MTAENGPVRVDRLIVHQFDPGRPSPGGIDSCLRGLLRYLPNDLEVAVVGVDTGAGPPGRRLGQWERHRLGHTSFWFLPVVSLDPSDQARRVPHSLRLVAGISRYRRRLPTTDVLQVHRMDSAAALRVLLGGRQSYFIHTQENGLTGQTSDSFWRFAGAAHRALERKVVTRAETVVVFNEEYAAAVRQWNPRTTFSPTWYDPQLIRGESAGRQPFRIVWVGRLEVPKDPQLAVAAFAALAAQDPGSPWSLELVGSGTMLDAVRRDVAALPDGVGQRVHVRGRLAPKGVAAAMAGAGTFLMTSHPGYEGYARVLVESMASGLPAVVTSGSDTGGLVVDGVTGFSCGRDPQELAARLLACRGLDRSAIRSSVSHLDAPSLVRRLLTLNHPELQPAGAR